jgi:hypothetical protein
MLPFNLSMGVMTFFISVGIGASLGRQFQLDPVMSGLLAFMAFTGRRALCRWQNLHSVPVRSGHFYRADHRHLLHPRLRVAEAEQHYHSPAERGADRRRPFV